MSEIVMRVGRVCPVCKRDGRNGQSVIQVCYVGDGSKVGCPECGTTWKVGSIHKEAKPEPVKAGDGKAATKGEK